MTTENTPDQPSTAQSPSSEHPRAAHGEHTVEGRPLGFSSITPFLAVADPAAALDFYTSVFGARLVSAAEFGGSIGHAELQFSDGRLQLGAADPAYHLEPLDPATDTVVFSLGLYVSDVDAVLAAALDAGARLREPAATFVSGDRYASIRDPFGVRWSLMTRVEDLSDEESAARVDAWIAEQSAT